MFVPKGILGLIVVIVIGTMLTACIQKNKYRAELASPLNNAETGVVILSAGSLAPCDVLGTPTALQIFPVSGSFFPSAAVATLEVDNRYLGSDLPDHHGSLSVLKLAPGKYVLVPFAQNPYVHYFRPPKADFEVYANETAYLGEFFIPACEGDAGMGFVDREERDLALLVEKNPAFANVSITKRLLMFTGRQPFWPF